MSIEKVRDYFKNYGIEDRVLEFDVSSATVELASKALNCKEEEIAKSMAFELEKNPIIIVIAGDKKVKSSKFKKKFGEKAKMIKIDDLENLVGHNIGGVCPFAVKENVKIYLDNSLKNYEYVYPACGSANSAIKLTIKELEKYSNFVEWIDVTD